MGSRAIQLTLAVVFVWGAALPACKSTDQGLLPDRGQVSGGGSGSGGESGSGGSGGADGMDGSVSGTDAAVPGDGAVTGDACAAVVEECNGLDDDCDQKVDEDADQACALMIPNARATCETSASEVVCLNRGCLDGYFNCDGLNENGCEPYCDCHVCEDAGADDGGS